MGSGESTDPGEQGDVLLSSCRIALPSQVAELEQRSRFLSPLFLLSPSLAGSHSVQLVVVTVLPLRAAPALLLSPHPTPLPAAAAWDMRRAAAVCGAEQYCRRWVGTEPQLCQWLEEEAWLEVREQKNTAVPTSPSTFLLGQGCTRDFLLRRWRFLGRLNPYCKHFQERHCGKELCKEGSVSSDNSEPREAKWQQRGELGGERGALPERDKGGLHTWNKSSEVVPRLTFCHGHVLTPRVQQRCTGSLSLAVASTASDVQKG